MASFPDLGLNKKKAQAYKIANQERVPLAKTDALSFIPKTYMVEGKRDLSPTSCPLSLCTVACIYINTHTHTHTHTYTHTHTHTHTYTHTHK